MSHLPTKDTNDAGSKARCGETTVTSYRPHLHGLGRRPHRRLAQALSWTLAIVLGLAVWRTDATAQQGSYKIVVNAAQSVTSLTASELSQLFLKQQTRWDDGQAVIPVDLPTTSPVRERFSEEIHNRQVGAIRVYWQRMIFSGREVPPVEKASDAEVIAYVAANANAIGYVSTSARTGDNVKVLSVQN